MKSEILISTLRSASPRVLCIRTSCRSLPLLRWAATLAIALAFSFPCEAFGQVTDPAAGPLPFSTHVAGAVDTVDLATSSITINIPVRTKIGKVPTAYSLIGNFHVFPDHPNIPPYWKITPDIQGFLSLGNKYPAVSVHWTNLFYDVCGTHQKDLVHSDYVVIDALGTSHPLYDRFWQDQYGCYKLPASASTTDGSGFTVVTTTSPWTIYDSAGNANVLGSGTYTDPDGITLQDSLWSPG
jgi:hypothetical protein